jgi:hypothetical protein
MLIGLGHLYPCRWRHCCLSKRRLVFPSQRSLTFQKNWTQYTTLKYSCFKKSDCFWPNVRVFSVISKKRGAVWSSGGGRTTALSRCLILSCSLCCCTSWHCDCTGVLQQANNAANKVHSLLFKSCYVFRLSRPSSGTPRRSKRVGESEQVYLWSTD